MFGNESRLYRASSRYDDDPMQDVEGLSRIREIMRAWEFFWKVSCFDSLGWEPKHSAYALTDVVLRIDKRKEYYAYFHRGMKISERKYAGLVAYWIIKFHPFSIQVEHESELTDELRAVVATVNERFASFIIYAGILSENEHRRRRGEPFVSLTNADKGSYFAALLYALRYRCLTIDSMMLLMETLSPDDFDRLVCTK